MIPAPAREQERPQLGDRVKLLPPHRYAGCCGVYIADQTFTGGRNFPMVRVSVNGTNVRCLVLDPEKEMRKL